MEGGGKKEGVWGGRVVKMGKMVERGVVKTGKIVWGKRRKEGVGGGEEEVEGGSESDRSVEVHGIDFDGRNPVILEKLKAD